MYSDAFICTKCPPILILTRKWNSDMLFNKAGGYFVSQPLIFYEKCGFILFKHTTFMEYKTSKEVKELFLLRYSGNTKCKLIRNYDWHAEIKTCECNSC